MFDISVEMSVSTQALYYKRIDPLRERNNYISYVF